MWFIFFCLTIIFGILLYQKSKQLNAVTKARRTDLARAYDEGYAAGVAAQDDVTTQESDDLAPVTSLSHAQGRAAVNLHQAMPIVSHSSHTPLIKESESKAGVNIALYVAMLLFVGGVVLLLRTSAGELGIYLLLWVIMAVYYGGGHAMVRLVPMLRPAALGFVGTALVALPIVGLAMPSVLPAVTSSTALLITSLIALLTYGHTMLVFRSPFIAHLMVLWVFLFGTSWVGIASATLVWYYIVVIIMMTIMLVAAHTWKKYFPDYLNDAVRLHSSWTVVAVGALALPGLFGNTMSHIEYATLMIVAALYYGVHAYIVSAHPSLRTWSWFLCRLFVSAAVLAIANSLESMYAIAPSAALALIAVVQLAISLMRTRIVREVNQHSVWVMLSFVAIFIAPGAMSGVSESSRVLYYAIAAVYMLVAIGMALITYVHTRQVAFWTVGALAWAVGWAFVSMLEVMQGWHVTWWAALVALILAAYVYFRAPIRTVSQRSGYYMYLGFTIFLAFLTAYGTSNTAIVTGFWVCMALLLAGMALHERRVVFAACSVSAVFLTIVYWCVAVEMTGADVIYLIAAWGAAIYAAGVAYVLHNRLGKAPAMYAMLYCAIIPLVLSIVILFAQDAPVSVAVAMMSVAVAAGVMAMIDYMQRKLRFTYFSVILVAAIVWKALALIGDVPSAIYVHVIMAAAIANAYVARWARDAEAFRAWILTGLSALSLGMLVTYFEEPELSILFLIEHVILVVYGLVRERKLYGIWGAIGVMIVLLMMLGRQSAAVLLLIGLFVLFAVVYVVRRSYKRQMDSDSKRQEPTPVSNHQDTQKTSGNIEKNPHL